MQASSRSACRSAESSPLFVGADSSQPFTRKTAVLPENESAVPTVKALFQRLAAVLMRPDNFRRGADRLADSCGYSAFQAIGRALNQLCSLGLQGVRAAGRRFAADEQLGNPKAALKYLTVLPAAQQLLADIVQAVPQAVPRRRFRG